MTAPLASSIAQADARRALEHNCQALCNAKRLMKSAATRLWSYGRVFAENAEKILASLMLDYKIPLTRSTPHGLRKSKHHRIGTYRPTRHLSRGKNSVPNETQCQSPLSLPRSPSRQSRVYPLASAPAGDQIPFSGGCKDGKFWGDSHFNKNPR
jgi:hypothetical protein